MYTVLYTDLLLKDISIVLTQWQGFDPSETWPSAEELAGEQVDTPDAPKVAYNFGPAYFWAARHAWITGRRSRTGKRKLIISNRFRRPEVTGHKRRFFTVGQVNGLLY